LDPVKLDEAIRRKISHRIVPDPTCSPSLVVIKKPLLSESSNCNTSARNGVNSSFPNPLIPKRREPLKKQSDQLNTLLQNHLEKKDPRVDTASKLDL
jgi:hypothetical protein